MVVSSSWVLFKSIETHSQPRGLFKKPCSGFFTADVMSAWYFLNTKIWTPDVCNWASLCLRWSRSDLVAHGSIMSSCIVYSGLLFPTQCSNSSPKKWTKWEFIVFHSNYLTSFSKPVFCILFSRNTWHNQNCNCTYNIYHQPNYDQYLVDLFLG